MKTTKMWAPFFLAALFSAGLAISMPQVNSSGCSNCVLRTGDTMTGDLTMSGAEIVINSSQETALNLTGGPANVRGIAFNSATPGALAAPALYYNGGSSVLAILPGNAGLNFSGLSGNNAIAFGTSGQRLDLGTATDDYLISDGTGVAAANRMAATTYTAAVGSTGSAYSSLSGAYYCFNTAGTCTSSMRDNSGEIEVRGSVANSAAVSVFEVGSTTTLTAGNDRFLQTWYRDTFTTAVARMTAGGHLISTTPFTLASVYVNNLIAAQTYGGEDLPANPFTVTAIKYRVRAAGVGGTTNNTFRVASGANTCDCTFACNVAQGNYRTTCAGSGGTGCAFAASSDLTYSFNGVGDCGTATDVIGNIGIEGIWQ